MAAQPVIAQWILDTRPLWPEAEKTAQLEMHSSRALSLLNQTERAAVLRYYHVADAKMALCSHLLKRFAVARLGGVPWSHVTITRDARTKPVYVDPVTGRAPVAFNVSHQAGLVALVAVAGYDGNDAAEVGVDVVCVSERRARDVAMVRNDGWPSFVDVHAEVLAPSETAWLKHQVLVNMADPVRGGMPPPVGPAVTQEQLTDYKLRCFYGLWNLREAWVKMTGDALLAEWLAELEFRQPRPPRPAPGFGNDQVNEDAEEAEGRLVRRHDIWFRALKVDDAQLCQRALGEDYMIATAVRTPGRVEDGLGWRLGPYEILSLDELLRFAETSRHQSMDT